MKCKRRNSTSGNRNKYSISQEICTRFLLCCALLWSYIDWFTHIHQAYFTGTVAIWRLPQCQQCNPDKNMDKYFIWIHYERLHNHNKAKHNKAVCIFLGIYCSARQVILRYLWISKQYGLSIPCSLINADPWHVFALLHVFMRVYFREGKFMVWLHIL